MRSGSSERAWPWHRRDRRGAAQCPSRCRHTTAAARSGRAAGALASVPRAHAGRRSPRRGSRDLAPDAERIGDDMRGAPCVVSVAEHTGWAHVPVRGGAWPGAGRDRTPQGCLSLTRGCPTLPYDHDTRSVPRRRGRHAHRAGAAVDRGPNRGRIEANRERTRPRARGRRPRDSEASV